ncbi:Topoisomerase 1-associated factor 1, partial [Teratosphaeriaceae sp. CCFEE 6253]
AHLSCTHDAEAFDFGRLGIGEGAAGGGEGAAWGGEAARRCADQGAGDEHDGGGVDGGDETTRSEKPMPRVFHVPRLACDDTPNDRRSSVWGSASTSRRLTSSQSRTFHIRTTDDDDMMEVWAKSETVDPEVRAYIQSLVGAVGGSSSLDDTYQVGDDAYAALQDILRWLRLVPPPTPPPPPLPY